MWFIKFMGSQTGRVARVLLGGILVALGLAVVGGTGGYVLAGVGLVPLAAGLFDVCLFAPLARLPFGGAALRARCST